MFIVYFYLFIFVIVFIFTSTIFSHKFFNCYWLSQRQHCQSRVIATNALFFMFGDFSLSFFDWTFFFLFVFSFFLSAAFAVLYTKDLKPLFSGALVEDQLFFPILEQKKFNTNKLEAPN